MSKVNSTIKCSECGELLEEEMKKCPRCGSTKRTIMIKIVEPISTSVSLGLKHRSGQKDPRGKPIREAKIKVKGNTQTRITIDRSKRLEGIEDTDVYHEVIKNGKIIHAHPEPKDRKTRNRSSR